jgi:hypothetical protein
VISPEQNKSADPAGVTSSGCARFDRNVRENPSRPQGDSRGLMNMTLIFELADYFSMRFYQLMSEYFVGFILCACRLVGDHRTSCFVTVPRRLLGAELG